MALEDLFGSPDYLRQLIGEEQFAKAQNQAFNQGLINASLAALAGSSQTNKLGQIIGAAGQEGMKGYQGAMDRTLSDIAKGLQMQEMVRKQKEAQQIKQLMASAATPQYRTTPAVIPQGQTMLDDQGVPTLGTTPEKQTLTGYSYDIGKVAPALYAMGKPELVKNIAEAQKAIDGKGELTGEYANVALGLYGTADVAKLPQGAFQVISDAIATQNKAKATQVNLPSEGERKSAVLTTILDRNIAQLQAAVGKDPTAIKPNVAASVVKGITGSDYLSKELTPDQRQIVEAAQLDILDAALTLRTGAAYTREQLLAYRESYFPQIGDKPEQVKAKQQRLATLLDSAYVASGRAAPDRAKSVEGVTAATTAPKPMFRWDKAAGKMVENN
jgi:hypothetical protein